MSTVSHVHSGPASPSQSIVAAAAEPVEVTDACGRKIKIRKIGPLDRYRIFKAIGPTASSNQQAVGYAIFAASVTSIDGSIESAPRSEAQIEGMIERLGEEGMEAVAVGYSGHFADGESGDPAVIKNS